MDLLKVINERRSIRKYKNEPVSDEMIHEVLEAARRAPSWANTQVCRYIVVKDRNIKEQLSSTLTPTNPARGAIAEAPCVICIFAKRGVSGFYKGTAATDKGDWFMFDAGVAMEHMGPWPRNGPRGALRREEGRGYPPYTGGIQHRGNDPLGVF
jgi:nitroreductase